MLEGQGVWLLCRCMGCWWLCRRETKMRKAAQDLLAILKAEASGGLFLDYSGQTKTSDPFPKVQRKNQALKLFVFHSSSSEKTPKPSEELILLRAGLGRRSAHVPEDADHKEITNILCEVYPKMAELEGAWLIHKATVSQHHRRHDNQVACPVCGELFSQAVINIHAEFCGVTEESVINEEVPEPSTTDRTGRSTSEGPEIVGEAETGLPQNTIIVPFIGENGIDQGARKNSSLKWSGQ
ncbi:hypothetical protein CgunFtcFv8_006113 [Champsocephalus gunnari]|uniref:Uncharacterized protein n=1 Tax=Champsocephalus gunnari TaxID=52237 RepID=A0AAN8BZS2_CHAGU|nr:hypothetical protein CgunFtcFv8_006113 [Champsocephalus gunnari]